MKQYLQTLGRAPIICPLRIADRACEERACCEWETFRDGFIDAWPRWFDVPPSREHWTAARRDWRSGNTGWEAAHNAQRRAKEKAVKAEHKAWADAQQALNKAGKA